MRKLGISVYPNHSSVEEIKAYMDLAAKYNFTRVFTCLLSVEDEEKDQIIKEFSETIFYAKSLGMEVIADVSPKVFGQLDISYKDLSFFKEIGADGIRLDIIKKNTAVFPIGTLIGNLTLTPKDPTKLPILLCAVSHRYFT